MPPSRPSVNHQASGISGGTGGEAQFWTIQGLLPEAGSRWRGAHRWGRPIRLSGCQFPAPLKEAINPLLHSREAFPWAAGHFLTRARDARDQPRLDL